MDMPKKNTQPEPLTIQMDQAGIVTTMDENGNGGIVLTLPDTQLGLEHVMFAAIYDQINFVKDFPQQMLLYFVQNPERAQIYGITANIHEVKPEAEAVDDEPLQS